MRILHCAATVMRECDKSDLAIKSLEQEQKIPLIVFVSPLALEQRVFLIPWPSQPKPQKLFLNFKVMR